ncbi:MAG: hypothetical protein ABIH70_09145 [Chloroflexota bacterium]
MESSEILNTLNHIWQREFNGLVKLEFLSWCPWDRRNSLKDINKPGVYVLGKFNSENSVSADLLDEYVIYFGKTNLGKTTSLKGRLNAFDGAAFGNGAPHAGGYNYKEAYGTDKRGLQVAICPVYWTREKDLSSDLAHFAISSVITRLEVCLRGLYVYSWGRLPRCNKE